MGSYNPSFMYMEQLYIIQGGTAKQVEATVNQ